MFLIAMRRRYSALCFIVGASDCNICLSVSEDYGKTFNDVTHLINHTFIQTAFGIAISPDHSGKVRLRANSIAILTCLRWTIFSFCCEC